MAADAVLLVHTCAVHGAHLQYGSCALASDQGLRRWAQKYQFFGLDVATGAVMKGFPVDVAAGTTLPTNIADTQQTRLSLASHHISKVPLLCPASPTRHFGLGHSGWELG